MKDLKNILLAGAVMVMCSSGTCSAEVTDSNKGIAVVSGQGDVLPEGVRVRVILWEDGHGDFAATDTVTNGQFRLEVPIGEGMTSGSIIFDYHAFPSLSHKIYLTPGATVEIDAVDNYLYTWPVKSSVPEQAEYELYIDNSKDLWTEIQKAEREYQKSEKFENLGERRLIGRDECLARSNDVMEGEQQDYWFFIGDSLLVEKVRNSFCDIFDSI